MSKQKKRFDFKYIYVFYFFLFDSQFIFFFEVKNHNIKPKLDDKRNKAHSYKQTHAINRKKLNKNFIKKKNLSECNKQQSYEKKRKVN
jgi:hypothetical protein